MMPLLKKDGVDYYESSIQTIVQVKEAVRLSKLNHLYPLSYGQIDNFLTCDQDGEPEGWLLFSFEKLLKPYSKPVWTPGAKPVWTPNEPPRPRYVRQGYVTQTYQAMLLLKGEDSSPFGCQGNPDPCPQVAVHALCRDPWSDPSIIAAWVNMRLESLSGALGGALELVIRVSETDVALQKALRMNGYLASHCEKDLPYHPMDAEEGYEEIPSGYEANNPLQVPKKIRRLQGRSIGEVVFRRLLRIRPRQDLGKDFLSPRKKR